MKALVIFNPTSGASAIQGMRGALMRAFSSKGLDCELLETGPDSRVDISAARSKGFDLAVAAGGDGTFAAVMHEFAGTSTPLGIIPLGTGNLVARELGIPLDVDAAVALLAGKHRLRRMDAMRIHGRLYALNASVGISASVVNSTTRAAKNRWGRFAYVVKTVRKLLTFQARRITVVVDGRKTKHWAVEVVVMNCGTLARMLYNDVPAVRMDDGLLDVWIVRMRTLLDVFRHFIDLVLRQSTRSTAIHMTAAGSVVIRSRHPLPVQADGDIIATTPVTIEILPAALTVIVPEKGL